MRMITVAAASCLMLAACQAARTHQSESAASAATPPAMTYPAAKRVDNVDEYHGVKIADPYRWLEDLDSAETLAWIAGENQLTNAYLEKIPARDRIKQRLSQLWNYDRYANDRGGLVPVQRGELLFYSRNDGLQNQFAIYVQKGLDGEPRVLLDPNGLSADGTISIGELAVSDDGGKLAYSLSDGGSDWRTIKVRDVASGKDLDDEVHWAKFTEIAWSRDGKGFFYSRYDAPQSENQLKAVNKNHKIFFHALGMAQAKDRLVYERPDQPEWNLSGQVSEDGHYLVITANQGTDSRNLLFYQDLKAPKAPVRELIGTLDASYGFIGNQGTRFVLRTDNGAERSRVIAVDLAHPGKSHWRELVAQSDATLIRVTIVSDQMLAEYLRDARSEVRAYALDGKPLSEVKLPGLGTLAGMAGSARRATAFFAYSDYVTPWSLYRYDAKSGAVSMFRQAKTAFDASTYETRQVWYRSKDGTRVPMFVTAKKGLVLDGTHPTLLYGYGGFDIPVTPSFSANTAAWLELGGVYASANLRGGGEFGMAWHEGGMKTNKQNVFDDFIAAAEYLIAERYTSPKKLAISGRSNGGLLVGATMLQRPDLFAAALPAVGVMDMLRFRDFTIGWAWESDYGSVRNADEFNAIRAYSPLHNIKPGVEYPPTLITTADHDDRVFPAHSFKFAAALQHAYQGARPMLIRVETRAGHGAGKPTSKIIEEQADIYAFVVKNLGM